MDSPDASIAWTSAFDAETPPSLTAAYGIYYIDNQPALLRALDLPGSPTPADLPGVIAACKRWRFNAVRSAEDWRLSERHMTAIRDPLASAGLVLLTAPDNNASAGDIPPLLWERGLRGEVRPFATSIAAARATATATDDQPATLWHIPAAPIDLLMVIGRGIRGYSLALGPDHLTTSSNASSDALQRLQAWFAAHEEEVTASVEVRDTLALIDYSPSPDAPPGEPALEGGFGAVAVAGYNPAVFELRAASDSDLTEYAATLFPSYGRMDLENYGKLVVYALRGGSLVTYPQPVTAGPDGVRYRTSFLWPRVVQAPPGGATRTPSERASQVGYRVQVREGTSTLATVDFGLPFSTDVYFRLPPAQRLAIRELVLSLLDDPAPRQIVPDNTLEVETVARLSPDGGALLFIANRLGPQQGAIRVPDPAALNLGSDFSVTVEYTANGSTAEVIDGSVQLDIAASEALVVRLQ